MKNNKGFAITSIIYAMLILFLGLIFLILGNLASRKAMFDKEKNEILMRFNGDESRKKFENGEVVYFDVTTGKSCDNYNEENSKTGYNGINGTENQNGCLKFYAFNDFGSDKLNLIINDILLNIGAIDQIIDEYELTNEEKLIVKIYLAQELYKYGDIKRAEKIILSIKKIEYPGDIVEGLLEYTQKNRALITKQRKRTLHKDED